MSTHTPPGTILRSCWRGLRASTRRPVGNNKSSNLKREVYGYPYPYEGKTRQEFYARQGVPAVYPMVELSRVTLVASMNL